MSTPLTERFQRAALGPRVWTAVVGIPLVIGALWLGGVWWFLLLAFPVAAGATELAALLGMKPVNDRAAFALRLAVLLVFLFFSTVPDSGQWWLGWLVPTWALLIVTLGLFPVRKARGAPRSFALAFGAGYLAVPFGLLARWRIEQPPWVLLAFFVVIWANDIAAYFIGLAAGRHKLAPSISPGKSWEGAVAGLAAGIGLGTLLAPWVGLGGAGAALWASAITVASQAGDLYESALKRRVGVKDSGTILPGHGGILDRFDGVLVAAPVGYVLLRWLQP